MSDADNDPVLSRAIEELRRLPAADRAAVQRVVSTAAAARVTPADEPMDERAARTGRSRHLWSAVGIAAAAAIVGFVARGAWLPGSAADRGAPASTASSAPMLAVSSSASSAMPLAQQFVFENSAAHRISVVGDFNRWDASSAPMTRSPDGSLWSVVIPVLPGRHVYGFMIDDSLFTLDPRPGVPKARDPDLGTDASVVMVGRP